MKLDNKKSILTVVIVTFVLFLLLIFPFTFSNTRTDSAWDGVVADSFTSGTGTKENPYVISSAGEFAHLKELLLRFL